MTESSSPQKLLRKCVFFRFLQKISKKRLTKRRFFRIIAHVERLTPQDKPKLMGICIVVVR